MSGPEMPYRLSYGKSTGLLEKTKEASTGSRPPIKSRSADAVGVADRVVITQRRCAQTRAQEMVEAGLLDIAVVISKLASSLTDAALRSIQTRISERGHKASMDDVDFLHAAIYHGIAQNIIERLEQRLKAEPQGRVVSGSHTASGNKS